MKSIVFLSLFTLIGNSIFGQTSSNLDSINGYNIFKLGTSKSLYEDYIMNSHFNQENDTYSIEVKKFPSLKTAFGSDVATISLQFDANNKLKTITIPYRLLPNNKNTDTTEILKEEKKLVTEFGAPSESSLDNLNFRFYRWNAKRVILTMNIKLVEGSDAEYWLKEIIFQNNADAVSMKKN